MEHGLIIILDFGGQYCHLIGRRIRERGINNIILPYNVKTKKLRRFLYRLKGVIFSGGPSSVYEKNAPFPPNDTLNIFIKNKIPILGLCYGHQLLALMLGGRVESNTKKEYGKTELDIIDKTTIFKGLNDREIVWMSHGDQVVELPEGFKVIARTENCPIAAYIDEERKIIGLQFHPEVKHTISGDKILDNFLTEICGYKLWLTKTRANDDIIPIVNNSIYSVSGTTYQNKLVLLMPEVRNPLESGPRNNPYKDIKKREVPFKNIKRTTSYLKRSENEILDNSSEPYGYKWRSMESWIENAIHEIQETVGDAGVILGLSGGVDSSVVAVLLREAIGDRVHPIFVNNGLLRKNEAEEVVRLFKDKLGFENFHYIDASELFLERLKGIADPEEKRKIIGHTFIEVFEKAAADIAERFGNIEFLAQGTIYPDRVESARTSGATSKIKTHHNTALPENMKLKLLEPLRELYKDEVRKLGLELGLPENIVYRQPFPGPGLAVRHIGPITKETLEILREADAIVREEIEKAGINRDLWQYFAVFLPVKNVGVMGDFRTYDYICVIRAVQSTDAMTANFAKLDWDLLERISTRIINEVKGFNRVLYDISNKPPSTIEFE